jgi:hypothetical protein
MFNKSGQSTLDTFKDILNDINDHCYQAKKNSDMHVGYQILANIRDTMSDRASINNRSNFFKLSSHESARPTSKRRPQKKLFIFEHKVFCFSFQSVISEFLYHWHVFW